MFWSGWGLLCKWVFEHEGLEKVWKMEGREEGPKKRRTGKKKFGGSKWLVRKMKKKKSKEKGRVWI